MRKLFTALALFVLVGCSESVPTVSGVWEGSIVISSEQSIDFTYTLLERDHTISGVGKIVDSFGPISVTVYGVTLFPDVSFTNQTLFGDFVFFGEFQDRHTIHGTISLFNFEFPLTITRR